MLKQDKQWTENQDLNSVHSLKKSQSHSCLQNVRPVLHYSQGHGSSENMTLWAPQEEKVQHP